MNMPNIGESFFTGQTARVEKMEGEEKAQDDYAQDVANSNSLVADSKDESVPIPAKQNKKIEQRSTKVRESVKPGEKGSRLTPIEMIKNSAEESQKRNPELLAQRLINLRDSIKPSDRMEDILKKVSTEFYNDPFLINDALDFLLETTEGELHQQVQAAKDKLNVEFDKAIIVGKNISVVARGYADKDSEIGGITSLKKESETPSTLRSLYREFTGNPPETSSMFTQLANKYPYKELQKVLKFLYHSLGEDLKSEGPSIERGFLNNLMMETRSLQAISGIYRFFNQRMPLLRKQFEQNHLKVPPQLNFEEMTRAFVEFVSDRFPTEEKAVQLASRYSQAPEGQIIILSQDRDAVNQVSPRLFKADEHKKQIKDVLIGALEGLEEIVEEKEMQQDFGDGS